MSEICTLENNKPILFETGVHCATKAEVDQHLQMGMQLIAKGQYSDALSHFHSAIGKNIHQTSING